MYTQLKSSATQNDSQSVEKKKTKRSSLSSSSSLCIYTHMYVGLDHLSLMDYTKYNTDTHLWFEHKQWFCLSTNDRGCYTRAQCQLKKTMREKNLMFKKFLSSSSLLISAVQISQLLVPMTISSVKESTQVFIMFITR